MLFFSFLFVPVVAGNKDFRFIENKGQWKESFNFRADLPNGALFLEDDGFTYHFAEEGVFGHYQHREQKEKYSFHAFEVKLLNSLPNPEISAEKPYPDYINYFLGKDEEKWKSRVKAYEKVNYKNIYSGIDLNVYSYGPSMKYDFIVKPGSNPDDIALNYNGVSGLEIDSGSGNLLVKTSLDTIIEQKPYAFQRIKGEEIKVECDFKLEGNNLTFDFPEGYNPDYKLIIDPVLIFASYSGSTADNFGMTATPGNDGSLIAGGMAYNIGYPTTTGAYDTTFAGTVSYGIADVVITRYDPTGSSLIYSTYIGGTGTETVHSLIVNDNDELYLYGATSSNNFPTLSTAYDTSFNGGDSIQFQFNGTTFRLGTDIYIAKLNPTGTSLMGSTLIGGSGNDGVSYNVTSIPYNSAGQYDSLTTNYGDQFRGEVMLDNNGNCLIASTSRSSDFPIINGFESTFQGEQDGVVLKFDPSLSNLMWSTYLGGSDKDAAYSLKVDDNNDVFVTGGTASSNFPSTTGVLNSTYQGGKTDGFISKIKSDGTSLIHSTFIGTPAYDQSFFIELDRLNNVFIVGQSLGNYPVTPGVYSNAGSPQFVSKLDSSLSTMLASTVFGNGNNSSINISPAAFLVDRCGNVYVSGWGANILQTTGLSGMPLTSNAFQSTTDGYDFYLIVFETELQSLLYGTYFGGGVSDEHVDGGTSRFDEDGVVYQSVCAGCGGNSDFPTTSGSWSQTNNSNNCNNGVFKFDFEITPRADFTVSSLEGCSPLTVQFFDHSTNSSEFLWDFGGGDTTSTVANPIRTFTDTGTHEIYLIINDSTCNISDTAKTTINVIPFNFDSLYAYADDDTILLGESTMIHAYPSDGFTYSWTPPGTLTDPFNSSSVATPTVTTTYKVIFGDSTFTECTDSAEVTVYVIDAVCGEPEIFVPNAFSPNNDGENDVLYVRGPNLKKLYFAVYDRWGELVFETRKQSKGWDGTYKGKKVDPAVFVYYLRVTCVDDQKFFKKGNITVIR